jgi:hypothetical protein
MAKATRSVTYRNAFWDAYIAIARANCIIERPGALFLNALCNDGLSVSQWAIRSSERHAVHFWVGIEKCPQKRLARQREILINIGIIGDSWWNTGATGYISLHSVLSLGPILSRISCAGVSLKRANNVY